MKGVWIKEYETPSAARAAALNHAWLRAMGLNVPQLAAWTPASRRLCLGYVGGASPVGLDELSVAVEQIGAWHGAVAGHLSDTAGSALVLGPGVEISPFMPTRIDALTASATGYGQVIAPDDLSRIASVVSRSRPSVYKDMNVRNVLVDGGTVWHVDFDDLTLAPAGYDLAKLLLSWAMTHGRRPPMSQLIATYNGAARGGLCSYEELALWMELNDVLTRRYRSTNRYVHSWSEMRTAEDREAVSGALSRRA